jgi:xanthine dehydrogenase accessory factor
VSLYEELRDAIRAGSPVAIATVVVGPPERLGAKLLVRPDAAPSGDLGDPDLNRVVARDTLGELEAGRSGTRHYGLSGEARQEDLSIFIESFAPPPRLVIFGAVDFTAALMRVGKFLGFHVTVCDARAVFTTRARFPLADEVVVDWPNRYLDAHGLDLGPRDAICVLTHDAKFDIPALVAALRTRAGYIGAMGSRRTHDDRLARLREAGLTEDELARLRSPIGLDLGARTPEETAVSVAAELIQLRWGGSGQPLTDTSGRIHHSHHS